MAPEMELSNTKEGVAACNGHMTTQTKPSPGVIQNADHYFTDYSSNTIIQGFKYMGERDRHWTERVLWLVVFCVSLAFGVILVIDAWEQWDSSPVLISFAPKLTPTWEIPFPAITICPETKFREGDHDYTEALELWMGHQWNTTDDELLRKMADVSVVCDDERVPKESNTQATIDPRAIEYLLGIAPRFDEIFVACGHRYLNDNCTYYPFTPVVTEQGLCYTYNWLDEKKFFTALAHHPLEFISRTRSNESRDVYETSEKTGWTLEGGYKKSFNWSYPRRGEAYNSQYGKFEFLLESPKGHTCDRLRFEGFKLALHHPAEVPSINTKYVRIPPNKHVDVAVRPEMITTAESLKREDPDIRQCYFSDERPLKFYRIYTQKNCQADCLANVTLKLAKCVPYYLPHEKSVPVCGPKQLLLIKAINSYLNKPESDTSERLPLLKSITNCDCRPSCTSLTYKVELSQVDYHPPKSVTLRNKAEFFLGDDRDLSSVKVFFNEELFTKVVRTPLITYINFLSNCGGILSLFIGFSFLSIIEILYYASFRLACNVKKYGRQYWSGSKDLVDPGV